MAVNKTKISKIKKCKESLVVHNPKPRSYEKEINLKDNLLKVLVINAYGGECTVCGVTEIEDLTMDHVNEDGAAHRKKLTKGKYKSSSTNVYYDILKNHFPPGFEVRCWKHNCNRYRPNLIKTVALVRDLMAKGELLSHPYIVKRINGLEKKYNLNLWHYLKLRKGPNNEMDLTPYDITSKHEDSLRRQFNSVRANQRARLDYQDRREANAKLFFSGETDSKQERLDTTRSS